MIPHAFRHRAAALMGAVAIASASLSTAAYAHPGLTNYPHGVTSLPASFWEALALRPAAAQDVWARLRESMQWQEEIRRPRVKEWIERYRNNPENIAEITERATPWLHWIVQQLEARDLPGEIALLPFVESSFDPTARSSMGARGLWQFMPGTADALGLPRTGGYDGRLDVVASTHAALDYIEEQAEQWYEGDLELSLAAYNAGAGTINNALRVATSQGKSETYWQLLLPGETMHYLPKLLAISAIIADPDRYQVALPEIPDVPAFAEVELKRPLNLEHAAFLAGTSVETLESLNPGLLNGQLTPANHNVLLVPSEHYDTLVTNLASQAESSDQTVRYQVQRGDSLSRIASRHGISPATIRSLNGIRGDMIRVGQMLKLPENSYTRAQASNG
ncbi:transglycosylase SLT domain-containing protein [Litchfieldella xinjiangensis]|uniref:transglycosylase SLT domain-containing protein n=1 Tax=Litchfieldella xinjiangensis TaxID=1166948 RepID=UPI00069415B6|nr:transglycosylase SLT domain-containing protein [Halomonas xinjiangensis]